MKILLKLNYAVLFLVFGFTSVGQAAVTTYSLGGYDAPNHDIETFQTGSEAACAATCLDRSDCSGAEYNMDVGRCWLKSAITQYIPNARGVLILKILSSQDGVDYPGGDLSSFTAAGGLPACSRACFVNSECRAFTYSKQHKVCWLKRAVVDAELSSDRVSGKK